MKAAGKVRVNRLLRPFTLWLLGRLRGKNYKIHFVRKTDVPKTPAIFAFTHISGNDTMIATEIVRGPAHILMATDPLGAAQKLPLMLLGMAGVDRTDKTKRSQRAAMNEMEALIRAGSHIIIFPEAIWNVAANRLVLPLYWGVIELAQRTARPIVPVALLRAGGDYYVYMGDSFKVPAKRDKARAAEELYTLLGDFTGRMVFDPDIQTSVPRDSFSPEAAFNEKVQSGFGFVWDVVSESRFLQRGTSHIIEHFP